MGDRQGREVDMQDALKSSTPEHQTRPKQHRGSRQGRAGQEEGSD
jgi:hypothetical protein